MLGWARDVRLGVALAITIVAGSAQTANAKPRDVVVMSRNLYVGAALQSLWQAQLQNPSAVATEAAKVVARVTTNSFPVRANAIAAEVAATDPDVIGIQELAEWYVGPYNDPGPATTPYVDYLGLLQGALAARGLHYSVAAAPATVYDVEVPAALGPDPTTWQDVRLVMQDVILARTDNPEVSVSNAQSGFYTRQTLFGGIPLHRNWQSVDVRVGPRTMRVFNTHLEAFNANEAIRTAQAQEFVAGPLRSSTMPVVLVCDCNSNPGSSASGGAYTALTSSTGGAMADAWQALRPSESGLTCCFPTDLRLSGTFSMRVDLVLTRGRVSAQTVDLQGQVSADRVGGLWPSDHAGIVARLRAQ